MRRVLCLLALLLLVSIHVAFADPVVITGGVIGFTDEPGAFDIRGDGLALKPGWAPVLTEGTFWYDWCRNGCRPGASVDFGTASYKFSDVFLIPSSGTVGGTVYSEVFLQGLLTFTGPRVTLPALNTTQRFVSGRFAFSGQISGYLDRSLAGAPAFSRDITGRGMARAFIEPLEGHPRFLITDVDYVPAAIPEPSTLLMSTTGLLGAIGAARRRAVRRRVSTGADMLHPAG